MLERFKNHYPLAFRFLVNSSIWMSITVVLVGIFNAIDYVDFLSSERSMPYAGIDTVMGKSFETTIYPPYVLSTWAIVASLGALIIGFNIVGADIMYRHAKNCNRNKILWCISTAFLSPFLTGTVYLLTRPVRGDDSE